METTQLVLSQFKNFLAYELRIVWCLSLRQIISKRCELVKLCHINRSGPVFLRHTVVYLLMYSQTIIQLLQQIRQTGEMIMLTRMRCSRLLQVHSALSSVIARLQTFGVRADAVTKLKPIVREWASERARAPAASYRWATEAIACFASLASNRERRTPPLTITSTCRCWEMSTFNVKQKQNYNRVRRLADSAKDQ